MDDQSKQMLDEILAKEPAALTDADKGFLRARRSYLSEEQRAVFAEVLAADETSVAEAPAEEAVDQPLAHRGRRAAKSTV